MRKKMERIDDILGYKNLRIYQDSNFFSFSLDSIILANFSTINLRDKKIVDFCSGNGVVPLILSKRTKSIIYAVEIQKKLYDLALKSIELNNLNDKIIIINDSISNFSKENSDSFDLVLCNPPYFENHDLSSKNLSYEKMIARHEVMTNLSEVCYCAKKVLKDNGTFCLVHRTSRLMDILMEFRKNNIEPKKIKFIYDNIYKESTLVLVEGKKCGKCGLVIDSPLILHNLDGTNTLEYDKLQKEVNI
jgi:tRNA1(Val) A37 N6-methylase TrmN6